MNTKAIIKTGLEAMLFSGIILSCNKAQDSAGTNTKLNEPVEAVQDDFANQIQELKNEAEFVIADFNNKTYEIKTEALKSKKNIDTDVKNRIIVIENQVFQLEDRLESINNQSKETWSEFSQSMKNELTDMKRNIDSLTQKISG
jgi:peptidoglycan hydrolase CwlO-like protein